jgi:hypothetical protein
LFTAQSLEHNDQDLVTVFNMTSPARKEMLCMPCFEEQQNQGFASYSCTLRKRFLDRWVCMLCCVKESDAKDELEKQLKTNAENDDIPLRTCRCDIIIEEDDKYETVCRCVTVVPVMPHVTARLTMKMELCSGLYQPESKEAPIQTLAADVSSIEEHR